VSGVHSAVDVRGHGLDWQVLLRQALSGRGVQTHYQPVVDLVRGSVVGYEALTRFVGYPVASPDLWFDAARRHGLSAALESFTLRRALSAREDLPPGTFLAVNIGPDVLDHPDVLDVLRRQPHLDGVVVELTEHARIDSYASLEPVLDRLRVAGAMIAIDDAGAGYAGLQHLLGLRPHIIKLDRHMVAGVDRDETKRALVEMIGTFASRIDAWVLAEGIEHLGELDAVMGLNVPLGQGYLLGRPAPTWQDLDRRGAVLLRQQRPVAHRHGLREILERTVTVRDQAAAATAFAEEGTDVVVMVDPHDRPVAALDGDGLVHSAFDPSMRIHVDTPVPEAAERAMTRPVRQRFAPLMCVDDIGQFVGVVRMERVLTYLTSLAHGSRR
jgi:EAL domain-containing protein (putative c-di-GMP-specific phosphodiesterase class I)